MISIEAVGRLQIADLINLEVEADNSLQLG